MDRRKGTFLVIVVSMVLLLGPAHVQGDEPGAMNADPGQSQITTNTPLEAEGEGKTENRVTPRGDRAPLREVPSPFSPVKLTLKRGQVASIIESLGEWVHVRLEGGATGWAYQNLFQEVTQAPPGHGEKTDPVIPSKEEPGRKEAAAPSAGQGSRPVILIESGGKGLMSLNFLDVEIREALSALALEREINVATAQDVSGNITVHLYHVTLDEALRAMTLAGGFDYLKRNDLYYVFKPKKERDPEAERLRMRTFKLRYAEADKVKAVLDGLPGMREIKIHVPTKTIVAEDTPENMKKIEEIISRLDLRPKQVMIEAKILEVTLTDDMSLGVNWNDILGDVTLGTGGFSTAILPADGPLSPVPSTGSGIFANLIAAAGTEKQFAAALDLLQTKTRVNTLSTPKILAIHGKPAKVQVGGQQGYRVTTTNVGVATETIQFIDTGTILDITPYIDDEGNVLLNVTPSINAAKIEGGIPVVSSTLVSTWLMARNGETVFIGGLIQDRETKTRDMIPCLGGLPILGVAFGRTFSGIGKSELVVLITTNVLDTDHERTTRAAMEKARGIEKKFEKGLPPVHRRLYEFLLPVK
jgi:type II secretory pathway component GspD/PulD (secretin)